MAIEDKSDGRTVQLKGVRLSFTNSLKDKQATVKDGKPKHTFNVIIEKSSPHYEANMAKIKSALGKAGELKWKSPEAFKQIAEDDPKRVCFRKGERFKSQKDGKVYAGYEGNYAISCGTPGGGQRRPKLLDRHKREVDEKDILDVMYGGSYCDTILSFYGTDEGGRGLFCTGEAIRSHQTGDRMGGGVYVDADDFDDMDDDDSFDSGSSASSKSKSDDFDF
ncbi:ssDNA-binding protein [Mesorhizobium sp. ORM6]